MSNANRRYQPPVEWTDSPSGKLSWIRRTLAVLLVVGLIVGINFVLFNPTVRDRAEYLVLRAQTYVKKLRPHARYVPTPSLPTPEASATAVTGQTATTPTVATTATPTAASTPASPAPTYTPTATTEPSSAASLPASVLLGTECHEPQGWNNCGPATLSMALCFYGWTDDQYAIATAIKPDKNDKNVSPDEMVAYTFSLGDMYAVTGYAADIQVLKSLLSSGFPVIVETWFIPEPDDEMGHYRLLTGYDDAVQAFAAQDAYNGPAQRVSYDELDALWKVFNRAYVVVTEADRAQALTALLGEALEPGAMYGNALATALAETAADAEDRYAWFNAGTNYAGLGRYQEAAAAYDRARMLRLPWRMLWYQFGPFEAYLHIGRYQDVIDLTNANLEVTKNLEESYYYRALARRAWGDQVGAREDLRKALQYNPLYDRAAKALGE